MADDWSTSPLPKVWAITASGAGGPQFLGVGYEPGIHGIRRRLTRVLSHSRGARQVLATGWGIFLLAAWIGAPPWWAIVISLVGAALGAAVLARWGGDPESDLGVELLEAISPPAAVRRTQRLVMRTWRSSQLPLYGLPPSWAGRRRLGSYEVSRRRFRTLELIHEESPGLRWLRVEVSDDPRRRDPRFLGALAVRLWLEVGEASADLSPDEDRGSGESWIQGIAARAAPQWHPIRISVGDSSVWFSYLSAAHMWIAHGEVEGYALTLQATDPFQPEAVRLVRVEDLRPYVEEGREPG